MLLQTSGTLAKADKTVLPHAFWMVWEGGGGRAVLLGGRLGELRHGQDMVNMVFMTAYSCSAGRRNRAGLNSRPNLWVDACCLCGGPFPLYLFPSGDGALHT